MVELIRLPSAALCEEGRATELHERVSPIALWDSNCPDLDPNVYEDDRRYTAVILMDWMPCAAER